jgi:hypothetical protein
MDYLNEFPKHTRNNDIDDAAQFAFEVLIRHARWFHIQSSDKRDYGRDYQLEVLGNEHATNIRVSVQLKGTGSESNTDGSISVSINPANLNYMMVQPYSFYVGYHLPTGRLLYRMADSVHRDYHHGGEGWSGQSSLTVRFFEVLDEPALERLAGLARSSALAQRNTRAKQGGRGAVDPEGAGTGPFCSGRT